MNFLTNASVRQLIVTRRLVLKQNKKSANLRAYKKEMKYLKKITVAFVVMIAAFMLSIYAGSMISEKYIEKNAIASAVEIEQEGVKYTVANFPLFRIDNFTDGLMINVATNIDSKNAFKASLTDTYTYNYDRESIARTIINGDFASKSANRIDYPRYWHGHLAVVRPLLTITTHHGIRIINYILLSAMLIMIIYLLIRQKHTAVAISLVSSLLITAVWLVPMCIQFSTTFYLAFAAIIYILATKDVSENHNIGKTLLLFFIIGGTTSFADLLTTPLITLCLPLLILLSTGNYDRKKPLYTTITASSAWLLGYTLVWITKWIIANIVIGYDISDAISQAQMRTSTEYAGFDMSLTGIFVYLSHYTKLMIATITLFTAFIAFNIILYCKRKQAFCTNSYLLVIACMPVVWVLVLRNHSVIHFWFVWRIFSASIFAYLLFLFKCKRSS